jgi:uncharacterized protein
MIIVSDTSAITSLLQIGRLDILSMLYEEVVTPIEVATELQRFHPKLPNSIRIVPVTDLMQLEKLKIEFDPGEAAAITLMLEGKGDLLLMDEKRGRRVAARERLAVVGVIGVLLEAKQSGLITSLSAIFADLERIAGFRISPRLKQRVLTAAGE